MILFKHAGALSEHLQGQKNIGKTVGFVPTMGALHEGHLTLISQCRSENDITVCSIFVNPTQFNNPEDFKHYPVTISKDIEHLVAAGCDILFLPSTSEIYPSEYLKKHYDLGAIEHALEGYYRPGHFQGVCEVVDRLLDIITPDNLYLGQKDFQQCMVIKKFLEITGRELKVALHICPTKRESSGLAMSSRNLRLTSEEKVLAVSIYKELENIKMKLLQTSLEDLKKNARENLTQQGFKVDYVEIARAGDLNPSENPADANVALIAAGIGNVRLIDNLLLN
ncbi:MAG TPA: pantoate--beta-alanine ligase [Flavisolibacter sp.]|nr:pantoate--beta-alanine ligase [Flavisolibacter sp.]